MQPLREQFFKGVAGTRGWVGGREEEEALTGEAGSHPPGLAWSCEDQRRGVTSLLEMRGRARSPVQVKAGEAETLRGSPVWRQSRGVQVPQPRPRPLQGPPLLLPAPHPQTLPALLPQPPLPPPLLEFAPSNPCTLYPHAPVHPPWVSISLSHDFDQRARRPRPRFSNSSFFIQDPPEGVLNPDCGDPSFSFSGPGAGTENPRC